MTFLFFRESKNGRTIIALQMGDQVGFRHLRLALVLIENVSAITFRRCLRSREGNLAILSFPQTVLKNLISQNVLMAKSLSQNILSIAEDDLKEVMSH